MDSGTILGGSSVTALVVGWAVKTFLDNGKKKQEQINALITEVKLLKAEVNRCQQDILKLEKVKV